MTTVNDIRLQIIVDRNKLEPEELTVDNLLNLAIEAEDIARKVGPFDQAFQYYSQKKLDFENAALYLERSGKGK